MRGTRSGKVALEVLLPGVVVHGRRRAAEDILERAEQERVAAGERVAPFEVVGKSRVEIFSPRRRVRVRRRPEAREMVAVKVVVRVHEAGRERRAVEIDGDVRARSAGSDASVLDVERAGVGDEAQPHRTNLIARRSGIPASRA